MWANAPKVKSKRERVQLRETDCDGTFSYMAWQVTVSCPGCGHVVKSTSLSLGDGIECKKCETRYVVR